VEQALAASRSAEEEAQRGLATIGAEVARLTRQLEEAELDLRQARSASQRDGRTC
jgi:hypothetical protein